MTTYDPAVIEKMVKRLYGSANLTIVSWAVGLGFVGLGTMILLSQVSPYAATLIPFIGVFIGIAIGKERVFLKQFQAQQILLQLEIEKHTRTLSLSVSNRENIPPQAG